MEVCAVAVGIDVARLLVPMLEVVGRMLSEAAEAVLEWASNYRVVVMPTAELVRSTIVFWTLAMKDTVQRKNKTEQKT